MPRLVKVGVTQVACRISGEEPVDKIKKELIVFWSIITFPCTGSYIRDQFINTFEF